MASMHSKRKADRSDPFIDEVRVNRRQRVEEFGNDLDRLAEHLRKVHADYKKRAGQFANLPRHISEESFPRMTRAIADPTHEEVQTLRTGPSRKPRLRRRGHA